MADPTVETQPYRVVYSEAVRAAFRILVDEAIQTGVLADLRAAFEHMEHTLRWYPQFGEPIIDLTAEPGQIRVGVFRTLVVRYAVYESRRFVAVAAAPRTLPRGFGTPEHD